MKNKNKIGLATFSSTFSSCSSSCCSSPSSSSSSSSFSSPSSYTTFPLLPLFPLPLFSFPSSSSTSSSTSSSSFSSSSSTETYKFKCPYGSNAPKGSPIVRCTIAGLPKSMVSRISGPPAETTQRRTHRRHNQFEIRDSAHHVLGTDRTEHKNIFSCEKANL